MGKFISLLRRYMTVQKLYTFRYWHAAVHLITLLCRIDWARCIIIYYIHCAGRARTDGKIWTIYHIALFRAFWETGSDVSRLVLPDYGHSGGFQSGIRTPPRVVDFVRPVTDGCHNNNFNIISNCTIYLFRSLIR